MLFLSKFRHLLLINRSHQVERRPVVLSVIQLSVCLCSAAHRLTHKWDGSQSRRTQPSCKAPTPLFFFFFLHSCILYATSCSTPISKFPFYPHEKPHPISLSLSHTHTHTVTITLSLKRADVCDKTYTCAKQSRIPILMKGVSPHKGCCFFFSQPAQELSPLKSFQMKAERGVMGSTLRESRHRREGPVGAVVGWLEI